ncbi:hypothetical protein OPIT5_27060 [Opitutaceae bacterium TAV5]|nr:hypothetical protein OPIT5_27060 [Opitutaceae bacterium TAV5]
MHTCFHLNRFAVPVFVLGLAALLPAADSRETWSGWSADLTAPDPDTVLLPADHDTGGLLLRSGEDITLFPATVLPDLDTLSLRVAFTDALPPLFPPEAALLINRTTPLAPALTASDDALTYTWDISALPAPPEDLAILWQPPEDLPVDSFTLLQSSLETTVSPLLTDADGNGIDDAWELAHFGHTGIDPTSDPDNDGLSNLAEFLADTDPNVAATSISPATLSLITFSP